jgi:predicted transcriptional regulator
LRDALLAVLRDAEFPLTTKEVATRVGRATWYGQVYSNLRAMDRAGLVRWLEWGTDGMQVARWEPIEQADTSELGALEQLWQESS